MWFCWRDTVLGRIPVDSGTFLTQAILWFFFSPCVERGAGTETIASEWQPPSRVPLPPADDRCTALPWSTESPSTYPAPPLSYTSKASAASGSVPFATSLAFVGSSSSRGAGGAH